MAIQLLSTILGILLIISGMQLATNPIGTASTAPMLLAVVLLVEGVASLITWLLRKRGGYASPWALVGAALSAVLGVLILVSPTLQLDILAIIPYIMGGLVIICGLSNVMQGFKLNSLRQALPVKVNGIPWGLPVVFGVIMVLLGVVAVINPLGTLISMGVWIGIEVVVAGISLISFGMFA